MKGVLKIFEGLFLFSLWFSSLNLLFSSFSWAICSSNSSHLQILFTLGSPFSLIERNNLHFRWSGYTPLAWKSWDFVSSHTVSIQVFCSLLFSWSPQAKSLIDFMMTAQNNVKWLSKVYKWTLWNHEKKHLFLQQTERFSKQKKITATYGARVCESVFMIS